MLKWIIVQKKKMLQSELKKTRERGQTNKNSAILFFFQLKHPIHYVVTKHRKLCKWLDTETNLSQSYRSLFSLLW